MLNDGVKAKDAISIKLTKADGSEPAYKTIELTESEYNNLIRVLTRSNVLKADELDKLYRKVVS